MARSRQPNGIIDTLHRLFGHTDHRSILTKYVHQGVFNKHLESGDQHVFKRSEECDNLVRNVLALDEVFRNQDLVIKTAQGRLPKHEVTRHLSKEREKLEAKFKAYGYWLNRMSSLNAVLTDGFDLEGATLEDVLETDGSAGIISPSSPYALRAVRLLEKVEEDGRLSKLSPEQIVEKAWALYRLGLHDQAVELAREATSLDSTNPEAWMLLAVESQNKQHEALADASRYALEKEIADPVSSHERWAEEMQDDAASQYFKARRNEKEVLFSAFRYWPKDPDSRQSEYKLPARRKAIRDRCVDWLFTLLKPFNNYASSVDFSKAYEMNGLGPELRLKEALRSYKLHHNDDGPPHGLTPVEVEVAELICTEFDNSNGRMFSISNPDSNKLQLMLLHVRYALKIGGYHQARDKFIDNLSYLRSKDLMQIIGQYDLFNALITHLSTEGLISLRERLITITCKLEDDHQDQRAYINLNLLRKTYDHSFAREQYLECVTIAREAADLATRLGDRSPQDRTCSPTDVKSNKLTVKFWRYLEVLAGCMLEPDDSSFDVLKTALLSVSEPEMYFANEREYMVGSYDEFMEWYETAYGASIIESGAWLDAINQIMSTGNLSADDKSAAKKIAFQLERLKTAME